MTVTEQGVVLAATELGITGMREPTVTRLEDDTLLLWVTDDTGDVRAASSPDGRTWTSDGTVASGRLADSDLVAFTGGSAASWLDADGVWATPGDTSGAPAAATYDRLTFADGFADWSAGAPASADLTLDGTEWQAWLADADGAMGHFSATPSPGAWVGVELDWADGVLTATWGGGVVLSTPLASADGLTLTAEGTLELDEALVLYTVAGEAGDTADSGTDSGGGDSGIAADSGSDSSDTADTAMDTASDSGDSVALDTAGDSAPLTWSAAQLSGEPGGWGCSSGRSTPSGAALILLIAALRRREVR